MVYPHPHFNPIYHRPANNARIQLALDSPYNYRGRCRTNVGWADSQAQKSMKRPRMKHAERVGPLLQQLLGQPGLGAQLNRHQAWLIWDQLVGEQIAEHARPLRLRKGVLEVQVDHPVWMQQLQMLKPQIMEKITAKIPDAGITDIYLRQTNNQQTYRQRKKTANVPPPWTKTELTDAEKDSIETELTPIDNSELKDELRKLFTRQKQLDREGRDHDL